MPATQASDKLPFAGKDDPAEELLPEPTEAELRVAELEQENRQLRRKATRDFDPHPAKQDSRIRWAWKISA
jgi:hypothetical protein